MGKLGALVAMILCFAAAGGVYWIAVEQQKQTIENADATVEGTVVSSGAEGHWGDDGETRGEWSPEVVYEYRFEGETYRNDNLRSGSGISHEGEGAHETAEEEAAEYPEGSTVTVHVNPDDPSKSFLEKHPPGLGMYAFVAFPVLFGLIFGMSLVSSLFG